MSIICRIFGHRSESRGWWGDGLYGVVRGGYTDGIGRTHYEVWNECARCGGKHITARFHGGTSLPEGMKQELTHEP